MPQTSSATSPSTDLPLPALSLRQVALLTLALTLLLAPAFLFIRSAAMAVSKYGAETFEGYAREALAEGNPEETIAVCLGTQRSGLHRSNHWGLADLLLAKAYWAQGATEAALERLERSARAWSRRYYVPQRHQREEAQAFGRELGDALLARGDSPGALRAYSAGAIAGGDPARQLRELVAALTAEQQAALWVGRPYLILEDFSAPDAVLAAAAEAQQPLIQSSTIQPESLTGGSMAAITVADGASGPLLVKVPAFVPLSEEQPIGIRAYAASEHPAEAAWFVGLWVERAQESALVSAPAAGAVNPQWKEYRIEQPALAQGLQGILASGYETSDAIINQVGLQLAGGANTWFVDRIDLYLP